MTNNRVEILTMYKENHSNLQFLLEREECFVSNFSFFNTREKVFLSKRELVIREFICLFKGFFHLPKQYNKKIYCLTSNFSMLFFTRVFGSFLGKKFHLYIYNFYLHAAEKNKLMHLFLKFLLSSNKTTMIVQSPREVLFYKKFSSNKVYFVPYCWNLDNNIIEKKTSIELNYGYIFTGGYTNRDYSLILECAKLKPEWNFVIVISSLNKEFDNCEIPSNIILYKDISISSFNNLMKEAEIVIVPLKQDVGSSGQMLCLGAMSYSRPIVYCNLSSINYYFTENSGIPYEINNLGTLIKGISKFKDSPFLGKKFGSEAYLRLKKNFTEEQRDKKICELIIYK